MLSLFRNISKCCNCVQPYNTCLMEKTMFGLFIEVLERVNSLRHAMQNTPIFKWEMNARGI